jgi:20S proteasome alpha/beta subunit
MTIIVGAVENNTIYIGGDRGASDEESIISLSRPKIYIKGGWVFGYSGSLGTGQLMEFVEFPVPSGEDVYRLLRLDIVSNLKSLIEDHGNSDSEHASEFIIGSQGRLFEFNTADWSVAEVQETAVGSGSQLALGSLYTTYIYKDTMHIEDRISLALDAAITYSPTCQEPIDILSLPMRHIP